MSYTQVASQVEQAKATIESLQQALQDAKEKQSLAYEEVKKLERDMEEFKNNKEGKIEELKVHVYPFSRPIHQTSVILSAYVPQFNRKFYQANISKQKSAIQKHAVIVKTEHKELQTATLEFGKFFLGRLISSYRSMIFFGLRSCVMR